jgi:Replication protein A interacting C-terminal
MTTDNGRCGGVLPPVGTSPYSSSKITPHSAEASKLRRRKHSQPQRSSWCRRQAVRSLIHRELAARRRGRHRGGGGDADGDGRGGGYADDDNDDDHHMEGVDVVVTPMRMIFDNDDNDNDGSTTVVAAGAMQRPQRPDITTSTWQDLSEDELLAFLEELERYDDDDDGLLEQQEDYRWAAMLQQEEEQLALENDYWEDQYDQWQQRQTCQQPDHELLAVPCPVCHRGQLRQEEGSAIVIYCCDGGSENTMGDDGSCCSFRLHSHLNLSELADRLRVVHEDHARRGCRQLPRIIQMMDNSNNNKTTTLTAFCASCGYQSPRIV